MCKVYCGLCHILIESNPLSIQSILISRFLLNLRSVYTTGSDLDNTIGTIKSVSFANVIVGNLGAPLRDSVYGLSNDDDEEGEVYVTSDPLLAGLQADIENMDEYPHLENISVVDIEVGGSCNSESNWYAGISSSSSLASPDRSLFSV